MLSSACNAGSRVEPEIGPFAPTARLATLSLGPKPRWSRRTFLRGLFFSNHHHFLFLRPLHVFPFVFERSPSPPPAAVHVTIKVSTLPFAAHATPPPPQLPASPPPTHRHHRRRRSFTHPPRRSFFLRPLPFALCPLPRPVIATPRLA